jgi:hypothetical protein
VLPEKGHREGERERGTVGDGNIVSSYQATNQTFKAASYVCVSPSGPIVDDDDV